MPYVQRINGRIVGFYALEQPGFAEEYLPPSSPELVVAADEQLAAAERAWRDSTLESLIWLRDRHRDQLDLGGETTLTAEQFADLLAYMQALRDWPQAAAFPDSALRPVVPPWIADQTQ